MHRQVGQLVMQAVACTAAMFLIYFLLNALLTGTIWNGMTISKSALTVEYCEFNDVGRFFHQSMNTYSNLVYFFFGVLTCLIARKDRKQPIDNEHNRMQEFPGLSILTGVCFIYLSFGSAFFHASLTWAGQRVDMNGTYGISLALLAVAGYSVFYKINLSDRQKTWLLIFLMGLILSFYQIHLLVSSSVLLPTFILSTWLLIGINYIQFRKSRSIILAISSLALILIALKIRALDVQKIGCDPHSLYQGHSVWHLLAGLSSFCSYAFFRFTPFTKQV